MKTETWEQVGPTKKRKVGHRTIASKTFVLPDGSVQEFEINSKRDGVATIAVTVDGKVLIVRQFRPGPERVMDELPGGMFDAGEEDAVEQAARRELLEETGYLPGSMRYLGRLNYDGYSDEWRNYFLALDCVPHASGQQLDKNESSAVKLCQISIAELLDNARAGRMTDPGAVLLAYDELQKRKANA